MKTITTEELQKRLEAGPVPLFDVRGDVEYEKGHIPGLITLSGIENELSEQLGRKVDLRTPNELSTYFRANVVREARVQYDAG